MANITDQQASPISFALTNGCEHHIAAPSLEAEQSQTAVVFCGEVSPHQMERTGNLIADHLKQGRDVCFANLGGLDTAEHMPDIKWDTSILIGNHSSQGILDPFGLASGDDAVELMCAFVEMTELYLTASDRVLIEHSARSSQSDIRCMADAAARVPSGSLRDVLQNMSEIMPSALCYGMGKTSSDLGSLLDMPVTAETSGGSGRAVLIELTDTMGLREIQQTALQDMPSNFRHLAAASALLIQGLVRAALGHYRSQLSAGNAPLLIVAGEAAAAKSERMLTVLEATCLRGGMKSA